MHLDVLDLRNFYYRTRLGRAAQRTIRDQVRAFWPDVSRTTVLGFGFSVPLLRPFLEEARRVTASLMGKRFRNALCSRFPNPMVYDLLACESASCFCHSLYAGLTGCQGSGGQWSL